MNLLLWIFRAHPLVLGLIAAAFFAGGYFLQVHQNDLNARQLVALQAGIPTPVNIEDFDATRDVSDVSEVHLRVQYHREAAYELTLEKNVGEDIAFMIPLLATDAVTPEVIGIALWEGNDFSFDDMTAGRLMAKTEAMGLFGQVTRVNGFHRGSLGQWDDIVSDALAQEGLALPAGAIIVRPFLDGRHVALDAGVRGGQSIFGIMSKIGGGFALLALFKLAAGGRREYDEDSIPLPELMEDTSARESNLFGSGGGAIGAPVPAAAAADPSVPLWKQRLQAKQAAEGLAPADDAHAYAEPEEDWTPEEPDFAKPSYGIVDESALQPRKRYGMAEPEPAPVIERVGGTSEPRKVSYDDPWAEAAPRGGGLRKILIGVVATAFVLALGLVLTSLVTEAVANDQAVAATAMSSEEQMAWTLAETLYPSTADPDRPFYEVDPAPLVQWFIATGFMAWKGDGTSMIILGSIVGAIFLSGFIIRYYFFVRSMMPHRRRYADFSDMGIDF